jgi:polysaccharide biosynthesis/export protein
MMDRVCPAAPAATKKAVWARRAALVAGLIVAVAPASGAAAQDAPSQDPSASAARALSMPALPRLAADAPAVPAAATATHPDYVIGADDVLSILFWRDKDLSAQEVTVRPDGKVTLPLLNDVQAAGLTPDQLRGVIRESARKFVEDPNPTVIVKEIKSRRVFITGQVEKPGPYPLNGVTTILQLIATAGGLRDFADSRNISLMRTEHGEPVMFAFNYQDLLKKKNLRQNIVLEPGDVVIIP